MTVELLSSVQRVDCTRVTCIYVKLTAILADHTVEYAMEAISHAGTVLAVMSKEGIAMAAEKVRHRDPLRCYWA